MVAITQLSLDTPVTQRALEVLTPMGGLPRGVVSSAADALQGVFPFLAPVS